MFHPVELEKFAASQFKTRFRSRPFPPVTCLCLITSKIAAIRFSRSLDIELGLRASNADWHQARIETKGGD